MRRMTDPIEYLKSRLRASQAPKTVAAPADNVEEQLFRLLTRKPYRKWKVSDTYSSEIKKQITFCVASGQPLTPVWFFGGYKLWSLVSSPEPDWAEFFSIAYFLEYVAPVAALYAPGVKFEFWTAHASIMKRQSNIPDKVCTEYRKAFETILQCFRSFLPRNVTIELHSFAEQYPDEAEYSRELEAHIADVVKQYETAWSPELKERKAKTSRMNIQWNGDEDWTTLSETEREEKIRMGPIVHDGYCRLRGVQDGVRGPGRFDLSATPLPSGSIPIGMTKTSVTKFWTGFGVLERRADGFADRILSPKQLESVESVEHETVPVDLVPLKNFKTIRVYPELRFSDSNTST